ncbi:MAG: glycosyltransferase family 2 protein [Chloroflexi bacterium]|nr:glycosyltransferase family 2 protein [Chloroflexota bacterium]
MVMTSLLLQENVHLRIHIVDTADQPVIRRQDVAFALRLAFERGISCGYEYLRERSRSFSEGRLRLLDALDGAHLCFMDDDLVLPPQSLAWMAAALSEHPEAGFVAPVCRNSPLRSMLPHGGPRYSPGAIFVQTSPLRPILLDYYRHTSDVLDRVARGPRVWEIAFLNSIFPLVGRPGIVQPDNVIHHLDYTERPNWSFDERELVTNSYEQARELARRHRPVVAGQPVTGWSFRPAAI